MCLNPYCSGRWSRTPSLFLASLRSRAVLILIVVEDGLVQGFTVSLPDSVECLNPYCSGRWSRTLALWQLINKFFSLNPYCSGRWSRTNLALRQVSMGAAVLILIVVEDGLVLSFTQM